MIREHIVDALNELGEDLDPDDTIDAADVIRAVVAGCGRAHVTEVPVDVLQWVADELSGPPWPP